MAKWFRSENELVVEVIDFDPAGKFHPSIVWHQTGNVDVAVGWGFKSGNLTPIEAVAEVPMMFGIPAAEFALLSEEEKEAIRGAVPDPNTPILDSPHRLADEPSYD